MSNDLEKRLFKVRTGLHLHVWGQGRPRRQVLCMLQCNVKNSCYHQIYRWCQIVIHTLFFVCQILLCINKAFLLPLNIILKSLKEFENVSIPFEDYFVFGKYPNFVQYQMGQIHSPKFNINIRLLGMFLRGSHVMWKKECFIYSK